MRCPIVTVGHQRQGLDLRDAEHPEGGRLPHGLTLRRTCRHNERVRIAGRDADDGALARPRSR
jgi:hypothetical protein